MNTESIVYPDYIMGKQLKEVWSEGLTRIEVSFYASSCQIEKLFFDRCFIPKAKEVIDNSLRVPNGSYGRVLDIRVFKRENDDELPASTDSLVRVFLAQMRKIQVGDKMAGRHGNKGIVAKIVRDEDMPFLEDGSTVDIVLLSLIHI